MTSSKSAVLFDIDGTLIDSNYMHVAAWSQALAEVGHPTDSWRIHSAIGMDADLLLEGLLGPDAEALSESVSDKHEQYFLDAASHLRAIGGARELVYALAERGLQVVLATSAPEVELEKLRAVLDIENAVAEITSSADVGQAKPAPDIVQVALKKAGVAPGNAIMVGDSVWDIKSAGTAGVACIGLLSGGTSAHDLEEAGAIEVYDDVAELLAKLEMSALARLGA